MVLFTLTLLFIGFVFAIDQCEMVLKLDTHQIKRGYRLPNYSTVLMNMDIMKCLQSCVRRKWCKSINFNKHLERCELNRNLVGQNEPLEDVSDFLYTEFSSWPTQIDPGCFERPCANDQYCLPRKIPKKESGSHYEHMCLNLEITTHGPDAVSQLPTITSIKKTSPANEPATYKSTTNSTTTALTVLPTSTSGPDTSSNPSNSAATKTTEVSNEKGIRLAGGYRTGRLEVFDSTYSLWRTIDLDHQWTWNVTKVVCNQLGYPYDGSYHEPGEPFSDGDGPAWQIMGLACNGSETSIFACSGEPFRISTSVRDIGITCFSKYITRRQNSSFDNIRLIRFDKPNRYTSRYHLFIVEYEVPAHVCMGINTKAADLICKQYLGNHWVGRAKTANASIQLMWVKNITCYHDDTPHPFYCMNEGWRFFYCQQYAWIECIKEKKKLTEKG